MKDLYNLLNSYYKNDKDIKIIYHEDDIFQKIDFMNKKLSLLLLMDYAIINTIK